MQHQAQTFRFTPELGTRLRALREKADLSLVELSHLMGRRPGYHSHLKRLEAGQVPFPSFALVADYLRACRASFDDLSPMLGKYTGRPTVREPRIREKVLTELKPLGGMEAVRLGVYDRKLGGQLKPEARLRAARKQAQAAAERRLLDRMMKAEVKQLGVKPTMAVLLVAHDYARMVWRALELSKPRPRPKTKRGRPRKTRKQRLQEARARIRLLAPRVLPARALNQIRDKVVLLFEDAHRWEKKDSPT